MKIAILGTRGIPNNYGGFEQLAQFLSLGLLAKGHHVYVYCSSRHAYQEKEWQGIHLIHQKDPEDRLGTAGQFIYDLNCIRDSRNRNFDVILNLGYTSSSVWMNLFPKLTKVITNMDGLEWKRSKYSRKVQKFLLFAEKLAVRKSDALVADSKAIQVYLQEKYGIVSTFIAYGAEIFRDPDQSCLAAFQLKPYAFDLLIARMEPENNIEVILDGVVKSKSTRPFLVVGNPENKFGLYLKNKFKEEKRILFMGSIYDTKVIDNLRHYANLYFHGHSVGGTNPSLLEAMGCHSLICAHDNVFNKSILGPDAFYFSNARQVADRLDATNTREQGASYLQANLAKIRESYSWSHIIEQYESLMLSQFAVSKEENAKN
jgi:glycosyltransferase involved in cell wall biosynthesis